MRLRSSVTLVLSLLVGSACAAPADVALQRSGQDLPAAVDGDGPAATTRPLPDPVDGSIRGVVDADEAAEASTPPRDVLVFGDSVARLLVDDLASRLDDRLVLDAVDCRRIDIGFTGPCGGVPAGRSVPAGLDDLRALTEQLRAVGALPDVAVVVLANNSSLRAEDLDAAMDALQGVELVAWVNTRIVGFGRQDPNNRLLDDLAVRNPRAIVVDWYGASEGHDWLHDHVHPNEAGQTAMGDLVVEDLRAACALDCVEAGT